MKRTAFNKRQGRGSVFKGQREAEEMKWQANEPIALRFSSTSSGSINPDRKSTPHRFPVRRCWFYRKGSRDLGCAFRLLYGFRTLSGGEGRSAGKIITTGTAGGM